MIIQEYHRRVEKLENKIIPEIVPEAGHFYTWDYKDQAELDKAVEKWCRDNPPPPGGK